MNSRTLIIILDGFHRALEDYNEIIALIVKFVLGIAGGTTLISAMYLKNESKEADYKLTKQKIFVLMFFAIIGSFVFAPIIVDYFDMSGSFQTFTGFVCALLSNVLIEIVLMFGDILKKYIPDYMTRKLKNWFKDE